MDRDGFPTPQELDYIKSFDVLEYDWNVLMIVIRALCWRWGEKYFYKDGNEWVAITGGWSGNELVISALRENTMFWMLYWKQSNRGGKYVFEEMRKTESEE